jgi:hypothetical protein
VKDTTHNVKRPFKFNRNTNTGSVFVEIVPQLVENYTGINQKLFLSQQARFFCKAVVVFLTIKIKCYGRQIKRPGPGQRTK